MIRSTMLASVSILAVALSCRDPVSSSLSDFQLKAETGKLEFFEGEPVYIAFSLSNKGADTAWVLPFDFSGWYLDGELTDSTGTELSRWGLTVDYFFPPDYRGQPVRPGERQFSIPLIQDRWGVYRADMRDLYLSHHLPAGRYTLRAHFCCRLLNRRLHVLNWQARDVLDAEPITFRVRARTFDEEQSFQSLQNLVAMPWDTAQRPMYLDSLMSAVRTRSPDDPLLPLLAGRFIGAVSVFGRLPDGAQINDVVLAAEAAARAQRATAAGATAVLTVNYHRPARTAALAEELAGSLAVDVAASILNR